MLRLRYWFRIFKWFRLNYGAIQQAKTWKHFLSVDINLKLQVFRSVSHLLSFKRNVFLAFYSHILK